MSSVREHHAPVGALRLHGLGGGHRIEGGQGAPRTCRCIETTDIVLTRIVILVVREHHAPVGALRQWTLVPNLGSRPRVREHHAPVGALRPRRHIRSRYCCSCQGAPRTCRCIETQTVPTHATLPVHRQGAPRTCRCIETSNPRRSHRPCRWRQGAPRTCRCIETRRLPSLRRNTAGQGAPRTCRCIETPSAR